MKALLLKDFYTGVKYCRIILFISLVFIFISTLNSSSIYIIYPSIMAGMIPVSLYSYDEREGWSRFCMSMPVSKSEVVSSKYLLGVILCIATDFLILLAQALRLGSQGDMDYHELFFIIVAATEASLIFAGLVMPFVFKLGAEKGRMAFYAVMAGVLVFAFLFAKIISRIGSLGGAAILAGTIIIYFISWRLSIIFYNSREI